MKTIKNLFIIALAMFLPPLGRQLWKVPDTALVRKLVKFYFMFRSLAKAPFFIALVFLVLFFLYLLFLVFCPLTLRRVHACQQVLATSFTSHHLLSFRKAYSHGAASALLTAYCSLLTILLLLFNPYH